MGIERKSKKSDKLKAVSFDVTLTHKNSRKLRLIKRSNFDGKHCRRGARLAQQTIKEKRTHGKNQGRRWLLQRVRALRGCMPRAHYATRLKHHNRKRLSPRAMHKSRRVHILYVLRHHVPRCSDYCHEIMLNSLTYCHAYDI